MLNHTLPLTALILAGTAFAQGAHVDVGSKPSYEFKNALMNGRGVKSLQDLKGAPTIIEFWGVR